MCLFVYVHRPVLFQTSECLANSDVVGDVIPYSTMLHLLYTRAHPDIKPPYQVYINHPTCIRYITLIRLDNICKVLQKPNGILFVGCSVRISPVIPYYWLHCVDHVCSKHIKTVPCVCLSVCLSVCDVGCVNFGPTVRRSNVLVYTAETSKLISNKIFVRHR